MGNKVNKVKESAFERLTDEILEDVLASLPMRHLVSLMSIGSPRLNGLISRNWVVNRMTEVTFSEVLAVRRRKKLVRDHFCSEAVLKKLKGKVLIRAEELNRSEYLNNCIKLINKIPGTLYLYVLRTEEFTGGKTFVKLLKKLKQPGKVAYISHTSIFDIDYTCLQILPKLVYYHYLYHGHHHVVYHASLLNGRPLLAVMRSVARPTRLDEATLDFLPRRTNPSQTPDRPDEWLTSFGKTAVIHMT